MATNTRFATGMHTLILLARDSNKLHSSESIAAKLQTNAVVIRRILASLQTAGLVRNHKGPSGGSELVFEASEITLADIYKAMEPASLFNDASMRGTDAKKVTVEIRRVLSDAEGALLQSLKEVTLQQIVRRTSRKTK